MLKIKNMIIISLPLLAVQFGMLVSAYACYRLMYNLIPGALGELLAVAAGVAMWMILNRTSAYVSFRIVMRDQIRADCRMIGSFMVLVSMLAGYCYLQYLAGADLMNSFIRVATLVLSEEMYLMILCSRLMTIRKEKEHIQKCE